MQNMQIIESSYFLGKFYEKRDLLSDARREYAIGDSQSFLPSQFALLRLDSNTTRALKGITHLSKMAYAPATLYLAREYKLKSDFIKAVELYKLASTQGDKNARLKEADICADNEGALYQPFKAETIYLSYATRSHALGMYKLAKFYEHERGISEASYLWYKKASQLGVDLAKLRLADMKRDGEYLNYNINEAIGEYKALKDYAPAKVRLGDIYLYAKGVEFDTQKAIAYYEEAYRLGDKKIELKIASILYEGYAIP
ncbi:MAG: tetratricopeptide repeat protein, partial [Campylobacterota bacterium]|nr:tetratricopeptide repeat protein [Campylobacterota bacterium]